MTGIMSLGLLSNFTVSAGSSLTVTVVETFLSSTTWTAPTGVTSVDYLVIAGGGGGGGQQGGGGGAGGFRTATGFSVTPGQSYTVKIGRAHV